MNANDKIVVGVYSGITLNNKNKIKSKYEIDTKQTCILGTG